MAIFIGQLFIFGTLICYATGACCPDTWIPFQGSCYLFGHQHPMTFVETEHYCRQHNGHMVNVGSSTENSFLKSTLMGMKEINNKVLFPQDQNRWIGLTDEMIENIWRWYDTDEVATFFDWYPGQPQGVTRENCVTMVSGVAAYKWGDYPCDAKMQAICEKRADDSEAVTGIVG